MLKEGTKQSDLENKKILFNMLYENNEEVGCTINFDFLDNKTLDVLSKEQFERYMMATGEMATDVGTILYGKEAVASGLIDKLGGLNDALSALHKMIDKQKNRNKQE